MKRGLGNTFVCVWGMPENPVPMRLPYTTYLANTMLSRIHELMKERTKGYKIVLLYFWLDSPEQAIKRVAQRVAKGGHHIPADVAIRRYFRGLHNLIHLYKEICDRWIVLDNMKIVPHPVAKRDEFGETVFNDEVWGIIKSQSNEQY